MQNRMKMHPLTTAQIDTLLARAYTGSLATCNDDGSPYVTPVHYVYLDHAVYIHGLPKGQKIDNIKTNPRVCMAVYEMDGLLFDPSSAPCDTNTKYESVILTGTASILENNARKKEVLTAIVEKYSPQLSAAQMPENMIAGTAVVEIRTDTVSGKYYG